MNAQGYGFCKYLYIYMYICICIYTHIQKYIHYMCINTHIQKYKNTYIIGTALDTVETALASALAAKAMLTSKVDELTTTQSMYV